MIVVAAALSLLPACVTGGGETEAQRAYDACVNDWNSSIQFRPAGKAAVAGVGPNQTSCFWVWSRPSGDSAVSSAMQNCQQRYNRCFVFYRSDSGFPAWQRRINLNGGRDPNNGASGDDQMNAFMNGFAGSFAGGLSGGMSTPSYGGGGRTTVLRGDCNDSAVQSRIRALQAQASTLGICTMSRRYAVLLREAAAVNRRCGMTQNALSLEDAARQADATGNASCSPGH